MSHNIYTFINNKSKFVDINTQCERKQDIILRLDIDAFTCAQV